ncbi:N-acetylneuraminate synthase [Chloroflexota bacterium]
MRSITIGRRIIGEDQPCFIIAEVGVNHNGDISLAKKLIDAAIEAGADAVKFQAFKTEELVTNSAPKARYQKESINSRESQFDMLKRLELTEAGFRELFIYARNKDIIFLSSLFDERSVDLLDELGIPAFKIGSGEITNFPLLKYIAQKRKPILLSTGMSTLDEVKETVEVFQKEGIRDIILLHCVSSYPAKTEDMNLKAIETLRQVFKMPVGLSDHTLGITASIAAVAIGACVIEKHFTLDMKLPGPDHKASLKPREFKEMVAVIQDVRSALGDGVKRPRKCEEDLIRIARRSIVAKMNIPKGTIITGDMLAVKRPGTGLEPKYIDEVIGRRVKGDIKQNEMITRSKLAK